MFAFRTCRGAPAPPRHQSVSFHRAGLVFYGFSCHVLPCSFFLCACSNSICFSGECVGGGHRNVKNKHNTNTVSKTASFRQRVAPLNECETWRDFTFASERFCRLFCSFLLLRGVHPSCQNPVKSGPVGPPSAMDLTTFPLRKGGKRRKEEKQTQGERSSSKLHTMDAANEIS